MKSLVRIRSAVPTEDFRVRLVFTDGSEKEVDLEPYLRGPVFQPLREDIKLFRTLKVDARAGTIVWDNGADIDPDVLYHDPPPAWMQDQDIQAKRR